MNEHTTYDTNVLHVSSKQPTCAKPLRRLNNHKQLKHELVNTQAQGTDGSVLRINETGRANLVQWQSQH